LSMESRSSRVKETVATDPSGSPIESWKTIGFRRNFAQAGVSHQAPLSGSTENKPDCGTGQHIICFARSEKKFIIEL